MERIKRAVAEARRQRQALEQDARAVKADSVDELRPGGARDAVLHTLLDIRVWSGILTGVILMMLFVWLIGGRAQPQGIAMSALEVDAGVTDDAEVRPDRRVAAANELGQDLALLQARVELLDASITRLTDKLTDAHGRIDAIAASTVLAALEDATAADEGLQQTATPAVDAAPAAVDDQVSDAAEPTPVVAADDGPWVINLASFPDQDAAQRFAERARSKHISAEQHRVTVKGRAYWRVQVAGFASAQDARAHAGPVQTKLGLKETWVSRR
jgi:hypothetical protein